MKIHLLVGTRPNFIKITQFKRVAEETGGFEVSIVHTGQHYDENMADVFFDQFDVFPDYFLDVPQGSPAIQIAEIIFRLEKLYDAIGKPDLLIVPGDVNSTLAGAITANKSGIKLAHLESGLRSFDRRMPEEHNRIVADQLSDMLFVTEPSGLKNLEEANIKGEAHFVGNTMIDTLVAFEEQISKSKILKKLKAEPGNYVLTTMHRPSNVDDMGSLLEIISLFRSICSRIPMIFPVHPRTIKNFTTHSLKHKLDSIDNLTMTEPLGYFEFQNLIKNATAVLTDSGGIQEECTFRKIPCLTLRENTERPITITRGTNTLVSYDEKAILKYIDKILKGEYKKGHIPKMWDGKATERIMGILEKSIE